MMSERKGYQLEPRLGVGGQSMHLDGPRSRVSGYDPRAEKLVQMLEGDPRSRDFTYASKRTKTK